MAKPNEVPEWATDDDFATGPAPVVGTPTKVDPTALKNQGFVPGTAAAAQIMNWLLNRNGRWAKWLDELISSDDGDDVTIARKTLTLLHSTVAKIEAANVDGGGGPLGRATLRSGAGGDHPQAIASSIEGEVYAGINSRADTEQSWLTLRGALREILGINKAGAAAPISVPNGLNVGTSFMPPAGYLPGVPAFYTEAGSYTWTVPSGVRALLVEVVGAGGGASGSGESAVGGGGGEFLTWFVTEGINMPSVAVQVGGGGISQTISPTNGGASSADFGGGVILSAAGGKNDGAPGRTTSPLPGPKYFSGAHGGGVLSASPINGLRCVGGASGAGWAGAGGFAEINGSGTFFYENGQDGAVRLTPYF